MGGEVVSFNTQQDLYAGEAVEGYCGGKINNMGRYWGGERIIGKLIELQVVCPDDLHPGWLNVKARVEISSRSPW